MTRELSKKESVFQTLSKVSVNDYTEKKNGLTYLSWTYAVAELSKRFPNFTYEIKRFDNNLPYIYDDNTGYMVFTSVTIEGVTRDMWLPVMDGANKAMKNHPYEYTTGKFTKTVAAATMFDINKAIMRCLVKNLAMFGLGLYVYKGEDVPEVTVEDVFDEIANADTELELKKIYDAYPQFRFSIRQSVINRQQELAKENGKTKKE